MKTIVIKAGGRAAEIPETIHALADEIKHLQNEGYRFVFVHGGGVVVSSIQKQYGIEPVFHDGRRMTSPVEMDLVDMGLAGRMNKYLVRLFHQKELNAVGLSGSDGSIFLSEDAGITGEGCENRTGRIIHTDTTLPALLLDKGYFPVLCSVCSDRAGLGMNINADEAALAVAQAFQADSLIFLSDIPGILIDKSLRRVLTEAEVEKYIAEGEIQGGMIPKVRSSLAALRQGVRQIFITNYENPGDLKSIITGRKGSKIILEET